MYKILTTFFLGLVLVCPCLAQVPSQYESAKVAASVPGLELPDDMKVNFDEGFITIQAKCKGEVKWLIVSQERVKYVAIPQSSQIIISIPPKKCLINVFAVGLVDGKLTEFARTNIVVDVNGPNPPPTPTPNPPNPTPVPVPPIPVTTGPLEMLFFVDLKEPSPEIAKIVNSQTLIKSINDKGHTFRRYDIDGPIPAQRNLTKAIQDVNSRNVLIFVDRNQLVVDKLPIPRTEAEVQAVIQKLNVK